MAAALAGRGHSVTVATPGAWDAVSADRVTAYPFRVRRIHWRSRPVMNKAGQMLELIRLSAKSDVIFANGFLLEGALVQFITGKPRVQKIVGDFAWERARSRGWTTLGIDHFQTEPGTARARFLTAVRGMAARRSVSVIVPSRYLRNIVCGWGVDPAKVHVISNSPFTGHARTCPPSETASKTVACIGRLVAWKHVDEVIAAVASLPDVALVVVGDGPERERLEHLARSLAVTERIRFTGSVPPEVANEYLVAANCLVLNSGYEGMPHVVLEAMHAGVPVVAARNGGTEELIDHEKNGLLVPPHDIESVRAAIQRVLSDSSLSSRLVAHASASLQPISWDEIVLQTERVLLAASERSR